MDKNVGLTSLAAYLPGKLVSEKMAEALSTFLEDLNMPAAYIDPIRFQRQLPGFIETNYDGWESQPWYDAWLELLPEKKRKNPFQGTKERRRVPMDPESEKKSLYPHPMMPSDAEVIAAAKAIIKSGLAKDDIDLVITHSQVPDNPLPQNCSLVQHKLGLHNAGAYSVDTCCSSFVTMIEVATALVNSGIKKNVLIVSSYIDSHVTDKTSYFSVDTGDAAVAAVITEVEDGHGFISSHSTSHGDRYDGIIFEQRLPKLFRGVHTGPNYAQMVTTFFNRDACKKIGVNAQHDMKVVVGCSLEKAGMSVDDIDFLVTHQPVDWAAPVWREAIGVPKEKSYESFEKYGNIATAAAAVNLLESLEQQLIKGGDRVVIASSGAGENHISVVQKISPKLISNIQSYV